MGLVADGLYALLQPLLLVRVLDVHELDANRAAVGHAQNRYDLAHRRAFQPEHVVDEDLPVHVPFREAVAIRIEFWMILRRLQAERVEVSEQVAADAIRPDQHQRVDRIERGLADLVGADALGDDLRVGARNRRRLHHRLRHRFQIAVADDPGIRRRPRRAAPFAQKRSGVVLQAGEEILPAAIDGAGIVQVALVELGHVDLVAGEQEGIGVHDGHCLLHAPVLARSLCWAAPEALAGFEAASES